jgi:NAD+ synthetase
LTNNLRLAIAQLNTTVGDLDGNLARILAVAWQAATHSPDLILFPELTIPGYPPRDILLDENFIRAVQAATAGLAVEAADLPPLLVGSLAPAGTSLPNHPNLYNAAFLIQNGRAEMVAAKRLLPAYDVYHEPRWFVPGPFMPPITIYGHRLGVLICEDLWDDGYPIHPPAELAAAGAQTLLCLSASPYRHNILEKRLRHAARAGLPVVYSNLVGATDELIFDGRSFVFEKGKVARTLAAFTDDLALIELPGHEISALPPASRYEELFSALTLGIRDFARKNGLKRAFIGLSGGIDSSLVAVLAAQALGAKNVTGIAIPSRYTDPRSTESARELSASLGIHFEMVELEPLHKTVETVLVPLLEGGTGAENIQARLRALILMAYVNKYGGFLLNTSNKTELTVGYSTLYGDLAGTLSPLGDLTKPEVYALAHWVNTRFHGVIPQFVLERPPSAELRPGQVDPFDYDAISPELESLVQSNQSNAAMRQSEHKRWQAGIILKVSEKSFGTGRMIPVTRQ